MLFTLYHPFPRGYTPINNLNKWGLNGSLIYFCSWPSCDFDLYLGVLTYFQEQYRWHFYSFLFFSCKLQFWSWLTLVVWSAPFLCYFIAIFTLSIFLHELRPVLNDILFQGSDPGRLYCTVVLYMCSFSNFFNRRSCTMHLSSAKNNKKL